MPDDDITLAAKAGDVDLDDYGLPRVDLSWLEADGEWSTEEVSAFFKMFADNYGPFEIGLSLGWSPAKIRRFSKDPDHIALMDALSERTLDSVERAAIREARNGNVAAMRMVLFSKAGHRGWSDTRTVKVEAQAQQEIIVSVHRAIDEKTAALIEAQGADGVAALQAAYLDADIIDAEVVE